MRNRNFTILLLTIIFLIFNTSYSTLHAQVGINEDNSQPDASALLDVKSTNKGILIPRMTSTERTNISSPATGLLVFDNTTNSFWYYTGIAWTELGGSSSNLSDADNDTKIQVEEVTDEDKIRFDANGIEQVVIDATHTIVKNDFKAGLSYQNNSTRTLDYKKSGGFFTNGDPNGDWQSFTPTVAGKLDYLVLTTGFGPVTYTISIYEGEGTSGTLLTTTSATSSPGNTTMQVVITDPVILIPDRKYTVGFSSGQHLAQQSNITPDGRAGSNAGLDFQLQLFTFGEKYSVSTTNNTLNINDAYSFPVADGSNGQALTTNGSGTLAWTTLTDSDNQNLTLSNNTLGITNGNTVDLSSYVNTDNQSLSLSPTYTLSITNGNTVNLSGINTDRQTADVFQLNGNNLELSLFNDGQATQTVDLSGYLDNTDNQTADIFQLNGNNLELSLSNDGQATQTVDLSSFKDSKWTTTGNDIYNNNTGNIGIGTNTPKEKLDVNGSIQLGDGNNTTPTAGAVRWNSTTQDFEGYMGDKWASLTYGNDINADSTVKSYANDTEQITSNFGKYGYSVSISGDYAIIGAYLDDGNNHPSSGSAYIFIRNGTTWTQQAKLLASDGDHQDYFGYAVSISGDYAVIGAYQDDDKGSESGSAYIFMRNGTTWTQQAKLTASDGAAFDLFGYAVSISGDYAIIGAFYDDYKKGSAYIFIRNGTTWTQQAKLTASDGTTDNYFGNSVSISGDDAIIGAYRDDDNGNLSGSAYVFTRNGTTWTQQAKLIASDGAAFDHFGNSVSISGDDVIIGAFADDDNGSASGSAYIFIRNGTTWTQQAKLTALDGAANDFFGTSVSILGDDAIIGANWDDDNGAESGSAYIFTRNGTTWTQQAKLTASDGVANNQFGNSVSISNDYALVGAPGGDKAYFFEAITPIYPTDSIYVANKGMMPIDNLMSQINTNSIDANNINASSINANGQMKITADGSQQLIVKNEAYNGNPVEIYLDRTVLGTAQQAAIGIGNLNRDFFIWYNGMDRLNIDENGVFKINSAFSLPNADGTNGQVLQTNGSGIVSWNTISDNDNQDLTLSNNTLSLTNDNTTVDLSSYNQDLTLSNNTLSLTNDNTTVDLSSFKDSKWTALGNEIWNANTGMVGIGIHPTKAKLEIDGVGAAQTNDIAFLDYFNSAHAVGSGNFTRDYSVWASGNIAAAEFHAISDRRVKNIQGVSNGKNDLKTLLEIEITNYTFIDTIQRGNTPTKKVIAQQVASVYPQAVNTTTTEVVPDIYQKASIENGWIVFDDELGITNYELRVGDRIKIITETSNDIHEVIEVENNRFKVNFPSSEATVNRQPSTVFIYGREVNDFHTVDYEAISMLNVSATQQLAKENEALKKEVEVLKTQVAKINKLEAMLQALQQQVNAEKVTVSADK